MSYIVELKPKLLESKSTVLRKVQLELTLLLNIRFVKKNISSKLLKNTVNSLQVEPLRYASTVSSKWG